MATQLEKRESNELLAVIYLPSANALGLLQDLGPDGVGLISGSKLDVGKDIQLSFYVPQHRSIFLVGQVVWNRILPPLFKNRYQHGIRLTEKSPRYLQYLTDHENQVDERREHPRYNAMFEIRNDQVPELKFAVAENISAEGLYLRTRRPLDIGDRHRFSLVLSESEEPIQCEGEVVSSFRSNPKQPIHPYGAGIKIRSFESRGDLHFERFLQSLDQLYKFGRTDAPMA